METATSPTGRLRRPTGVGVVLSVLLAGSVLAAERNAPPPLDKMAPELRQIEETFRKGRWKESLDQIDHIEASLQEMALSIEKVVGIATMDEVGFAIEDLRRAIKDRNLPRTEDAYLKIESQYLDLCERFSFQIPPAIQLVQMSLEKAYRERGEGDLASAARDLEVAYNRLPWMEEVLRRIGVAPSQLWQFRSTVVGARAAMERGDRDGVAREVKTALDVLPGFIFSSLKAATPGNGDGNHP
jgi:hypothetical protein